MAPSSSVTTRMLPALVPRQISFVTSCRAQVGRVTPCAPRSADSFPNGAHGVTRPTTSRNLFVTVLGSHRLEGRHFSVPSSLSNSDDSQGGNLFQKRCKTEKLKS